MQVQSYGASKTIKACNNSFKQMLNKDLTGQRELITTHILTLN